MDRVSALGYVLNGLGKRVFRDADLANGLDGTDLSALWHNGVQEEILHVIEAAGIIPGDADDTQLLQGIQASVFSAFPASLGASGWQKLASGLIVQWATGATVSGASDLIYYPIVFPNAVLGQVVIEENSVGWQSGGTVQPTVFGTAPYSAAAFKLLCARWNGTAFQFAGGDAYFYIAVGH